MKVEDFRKRRNARELNEHELDQDALEKLIQEKFERARAYREALYQREAELIEQD